MEERVELLINDNGEAQLMGVIAAVVAVIITLVLFALWRRRISVGHNVLLTGLCDAGKTLIYARLMHTKYVQTHTSRYWTVSTIRPTCSIYIYLSCARSPALSSLLLHGMRNRIVASITVPLHRLAALGSNKTTLLPVSCSTVSNCGRRWKMDSTQDSNGQNAKSSKPYSVDIGGMRIRYKEKSETFTEDNLVSKEPFGQFKAWFEIACNTPGIGEANAMFLATATKDGMPSVRPVLLKSFGTDGFKFYTNYESRKARELDENPNAALTFFWEPLRRTVRIEGTVQKTSAEDSDNYFNSRPYHGQIGSISSRQSTVIPNRDFLIEKEKHLQKEYPDTVKRPEWWGGYIVVPKSVEFWQGQSDRLHDRIKFRRPKPDEKVDNYLVHEGQDGWVYERLSP